MTHPLDEQWNSAAVDFDDELPPDGEYQAQVDRFDYVDSQKNGQRYLKTFLRIYHGAQAGRLVTTLHSLDDPDRFTSLKRHLLGLGAELPQSLDDLHASLVATLDNMVVLKIATASKVNTATGERYRNAYVQRSLGKLVGEEAMHQEADGVTARQRAGAGSTGSGFQRASQDDGIAF